MTPQHASVRVELIHDPAHLGEIADPWRQLAVERGNAFITPEWFDAWWAHYRDGHEPLVAVARRDGSVAGVIPLVATTGRWPTWRFAGANLGDHFHPAAPPEDEVEVAAAAATALATTARGSRAPALILDNVDATAPWPQALASSVAKRPALVRDRASVLPRAAIAGTTWERYLGSLSRNLRSQLGRKRRGLEKGHELAVRWTRDETEVGKDLATLFRLHDARFAVHRLSSSLTSEVARAFHGDFALAAHRRGWLRLCFLEVDGEPVAAWYGWRLGERFSYYQAGFDPRWSDHSVGLLLFAATIEAAIEEGAAEYDMLLGDEPFKARFADSVRPVHTLVATQRLHFRRFAVTAEIGVRRAARRLPPRVREPVRRGAAAVTNRLALTRKR
jgi:CelD/BcsL family acetyltransferase involved in cellulose biosynthesis